MHHLRKKALLLIALLPNTPLLASSQTRRDSAGVVIVENARAAGKNGEALRVSRKPRLLIKAAAAGAIGFGEVRGVARLSDGSIAVADASTLSLYIFDKAGQLQATMAGANDGPGQLQNLLWMRRMRGDTIAIGKGFTAVSLYSKSGEFVGSVPARAGSGRPLPYTLLGLSLNGIGLVARRPSFAMRDVGTQWTDTVAIALTSRSGDVGDSIGRIPVTQLQQGPRAPKPVWFAPEAVVAAGENQFWIGFGDRFEIRRYSAAGRLESIIRRQWTAEPITDENWESWVQEWAKLWVSSSGEERAKELDELRQAPWADVHPAFSQLLVDASNRLWVRRANWRDAIVSGSMADYPDSTSQWSVFDVNGVLLGELDMPIGFKPFDIGKDYVLGGQVVNGKIHITMYALTK